ncbi:MAG: hypothetical protein HY899_11215, partial [Deltaproteobacteria bacterium]|nr:hypothetical protein [Deltaproteobacteria bacterium]
MRRRSFFGWLSRLGAGCFAWSVAAPPRPLSRVNLSLVERAFGEPTCGNDVCTTSDVCIDDLIG